MPEPITKEETAVKDEVTNESSQNEDKINVNDKNKNEITSTTNTEKFTELESKINSIAQAINTLKSPTKEGEPVNNELVSRLENIETQLANVSSKLHNEEKFETVAEILQEHPELLDESSGLPVFSLNQPIDKIKDEAERIVQASHKIAAKRLQEYERRYGRLSSLSQPVSKEDLDRQIKQDLEDIRSTDKEKVESAATRLFWRRFNRVTG